MAENRLLVSRVQSMEMPGSLTEVARAHEAMQPSEVAPREAAANLRAAFSG